MSAATAKDVIAGSAIDSVTGLAAGVWVDFPSYEAYSGALFPGFEGEDRVLWGASSPPRPVCRCGLVDEHEYQCHW